MGLTDVDADGWLGPGRAADPGTWDLRGRRPSAAVAAFTAAEVAEVVRRCRADGLALAALGGGTRRHRGNPPRRYDVALLTAGSVGDVAYEAAEAVLTAPAGVRLDDLVRLAARHRQVLPFDGPPGATLGGAVSVGVAGERRLRFGPLRDWVLGVEAVTGYGAEVRGGGATVKNVSGYDMPRLLTGSLGTLAVLTRVTLRLVPQEPWSVRGVRAPADTGDPAWDVLARRPGVLVVRLDAGVGGRDARVLVVADGHPEEVPLPSGEPLDTTGCADALEALPLADAAPVAVSAGVVAGDEAGFREACGVSGARVSALCGTGVVRAAWDDVERAAVVVPRLRRAAEASGGSLVLDSAPGGFPVDAWGDPGGAVGLMRRVKAAYDPGGVLAPGRFCGGI